jgi:hypothetical protein
MVTFFLVTAGLEAALTLVEVNADMPRTSAKAKIKDNNRRFFFMWSSFLGGYTSSVCVSDSFFF